MMRKKLTTEDVKRIIRESRVKKEYPGDDDAPYADVPSAQEPARPFTPASRDQLQDASVRYGNRRDELSTSAPPVQPKPPQRGSAYVRAVLGTSGTIPTVNTFSNALFGKRKKSGGKH